MHIKAVAHISQVRGGSQARIMSGDDGKKYVVKFMGNPQCTRVLANDYLACRLARMIGLSVPEPVIILVDEKTILEQQITFTLAGRAVAARPGLQFGSALVTGGVLDWLPGTMLGRVRNLREFAGLLAFDKWTGNADGRQVVFHKDHVSGNTMRRSLILATASMRASGVFPTLRCGECTGSMMSMSGSNRGTTLIHGCQGSRGFPRGNSRALRTRSHASGMANARTATLTGSLVGAPQQSPTADRRLQDFQQKPFSELDDDDFAARHRVPELSYLLTNAIM